MEVEQLTGKTYRLVPDPRIEEYVDAAVEIAGPDDPYHVIRYVPRFEEDLPHFLAHEAGHVLRFYRGPPEYRLLPRIAEEHRRLVMRELDSYLAGLARRRVPIDVTEGLVRAWHDGVVRQVTNIPVDMRIERWICEGYRSLRPVQRRSLKREVAENTKGLSRLIKAFTPEKVYRATNAMNAAFANYMSWLLGDKRIRRAYLKTPYNEDGQRLARAVWDSQDDGQRQDIETVDRWAIYFEPVPKILEKD